MSDVECPYCGEEQIICHDGGYGLEEDVTHNQECSNCEKYFTYTTGIILVYEAKKSECLNGGNLDYEVSK